MRTRPFIRSPGPSPARIASLVLALAILLLSGIPILGSTSASPAVAPTGSPHSGPPSLHAPPVIPSEVVRVLNQTTGDLSSFWGVGVDGGTPYNNATAEIRGTPLNWTEYPAGKLADSFDMTIGKVWINGFPAPEGSNESEFVHWCESVACNAILAVPGEIDNASFAAYEVTYTEQTLGFHPKYWEVGNEPFGWEHFGIQWKNWTGSNAQTVNQSAYAQVVQQYVTAMKAVDPMIHILGLPGVGAGSASDAPWINATVKLNGPNISGIAVHEYPAEHVGTGNLSGFYATLSGPNGLSTRLATDQGTVSSACSTCHIPLFVDEFGSGTGTAPGGWQPFMQNYSQATYVAAELAIMLRSGVFNADLYNLRSAYNGSIFNSSGAARPLDSLYTQILPHLGPLSVATNITKSVGGVYVTATESTRNNTVAVLAVNANTAKTVQLTLGGPLFPGYGSYATWRAVNSSTPPYGTYTSSTGFGNTSLWTLAPQTVLLISVCRTDPTGVGGSIYGVTFCESGLPPGTNWSVTLGSTTRSSTGGTISFLEPNATYSYDILAVPGWRTLPVTGSVTLHGWNSSVAVPWTPVTYPVNFTETNLLAGTRWTVTVDGTPYSSTSSTIALLLPNGSYNYTLGIVPGWTPAPASGSFVVNVTPLSIAVNWTRVTYLVSFDESGLPSGTNWSVTFDGSPANSTGATLSFSAVNGTFGYSIGNVTGYTPDARSGSLAITGASFVVPISWSVAPYRVVFQEQNLSAGVNWSVALNGTPQGGTTSNFTFYEPNGSYGYVVGAVPGWTTTSPSGSVVVTGATAVVNVFWTRVVYGVTFNETNLPGGTLWSVVLNNVSLNSAGRSILFHDPNGSYPFTVPGVPGFTPSTPQGTAVVNGSPLLFTINFPHSTYTVVFTETGLPHGTTWYANVSGHAAAKSFGTTATDRLPNGTFNFTIACGIASYLPIPAYGEFTVQGSMVSINLSFARAYNYTFTESGFASGLNWTVSVLNESLANSSATTLVMRLPVGSFTYDVVGWPGGFSPVPPSGPFSVSGPSGGLTITFVGVVYAVTFTETGLPANQSWSVTVNTVTNGTTTATGVAATVGFSEPNGSFTYGITGVAGWHTLFPYNGSKTVQGHPLSENVYFSQELYNVYFNESGLLAGKNWSVTFNGTPEWTTSLSGPTVLHFPAVPNGSYLYVIQSVAGYQINLAAYHGTLVVDDRDTTLSVVFSVFLLGVSFSESGLPPALRWGVTFNGTSLNLTTDGGTDTLTFPSEPNGSYPYSIRDNGGYHQYTLPYHGTTTVPVNVTLVYVVFEYGLSFVPTGLPSGTNWSVTAGGATLWNPTGGPILFSEPNGSGVFQVGALANWKGTPSSGPYSIDGANVSFPIRFNATFAVTFTESGLPPNTPWSVVLGGVVENGTGPSIVFAEPNGSYSYQIGSVIGYYSSVTSGSAVVSGMGLSIPVPWLPFHYVLTFTESGLPAGSLWSVTIGGTTNASSTPVIKFYEIDGTYLYSLRTPAGYTVTSYSGSVSVTGMNLSVPIRCFVTEYVVTFAETGLPSGTTWSVDVAGTGATGSNGSLTLMEANGSFTYRLGLVPGWTPSAASGTDVVSGGDVTVQISWTQTTYVVTFKETGLASGTPWTVTVNGVTFNSTTGTLTLVEPNGTWAFTVGPVSGQESSPTTGSVSVKGGPVEKAVEFTATTSGPTILGVPTLETVGILAAIVVVASILWVVSHRPRRGPPTPEQSPDATTPEAPPVPE